MLSANMSRKGNLESELAEVRSLLSRSDQKIRALRIRSRRSGRAARVGSGGSSQQIYEQHPDVVATKKRIEALKEQIAKGKKSADHSRKRQRASAVLTVKRKWVDRNSDSKSANR